MFMHTFCVLQRIFIHSMLDIYIYICVCVWYVYCFWQISDVLRRAFVHLVGCLVYIYIYIYIYIFMCTHVLGICV
jgi:hypothetical protein